MTAAGAFKARSIRRRPIQEQVDRELAEVVTGLPWSPKDNSKDQDKDTFVFPAGQLRKTVTGQDDGLQKDTSTGKAAEEEEQFPDGDLDPRMAEALSPEEVEALEEPQHPRSRPREGEEPLDLFSRLPVRWRITRHFGVGSPEK